jgi:hypothetical protein
MKSLLILLLVFALSAALFLTRPTKADFETYIRADGVKIVEGKVSGGKTIADTIGEKMKTFAGTSAAASKSPADLYLEQCTFENRVFWTNVRFNGKLAFTGAVGHWFERDGSS